MDPGAGRVLCFAPHPDDEILGAGGTLHLHGNAGAAVAVVLATDGTAGDPEGRYDRAGYALRRRQESASALAVLGLPPPQAWGLPDSCEITEADKVGVTARVVEALRAFAPDRVYLPWEEDGNSDHLVLHETVLRGLRAVGFAGQAWGYEVWSPMPRPDAIVDITTCVAVKQRALACHETQFAYSDLAHMVFGLNAYRSLLLERSGGFGEALQRVVV